MNRLNKIYYPTVMNRVRQIDSIKWCVFLMYNKGFSAQQVSYWAPTANYRSQKRTNFVNLLEAVYLCSYIYSLRGSPCSYLGPVTTSTQVLGSGHFSPCYSYPPQISFLISLFVLGGLNFSSACLTFHLAHMERKRLLINPCWLKSKF